MPKKYIIKFIKHFLDNKILNKIYYIRSYFTKYHSLNSLDKKVEKYLNFKNGFFIELGANDGLRYSNTLFFEREKNWRGVLIEPITEKYIFCKKNRAKTNTIVNCACSSKNQKLRLINADLMTTINNNKFINFKEHLQLAKKHSDAKQTIFTTYGKTLNYILKKYKIPKIIDFLSLDTEGNELDILKGLNLNIYIIRLILIETININLVIKYLEKYNFFLKEKINVKDYIFLNKLFYDKK